MLVVHHGQSIVITDMYISPITQNMILNGTDDDDELVSIHIHPSDPAFLFLLLALGHHYQN